MEAEMFLAYLAVMILAFLWIVLWVGAFVLSSDIDRDAQSIAAFVAGTGFMFLALFLADNILSLSPEHRAAKAHRVIELATVAAETRPALATLEAAAATAKAAMTAAAKR